MKITRRFIRFPLVLSLAVVFLTSAQTTEKTLGKRYLAFVGTYTTKTSSKGIYAYRFDAETGQLSAIGVAAESRDPSFLAVHPNGKFLYAVNETGNYQVQASGAVRA
jgi:6-phosphogluconolactonase